LAAATEESFSEGMRMKVPSAAITYTTTLPVYCILLSKSTRGNGLKRIETIETLTPTTISSTRESTSASKPLPRYNALEITNAQLNFVSLYRPLLYNTPTSRPNALPNILSPLRRLTFQACNHDASSSQNHKTRHGSGIKSRTFRHTAPPSPIWSTD
jgi:hypothetical protein